MLNLTQNLLMPSGGFKGDSVTTANNNGGLTLDGSEGLSQEQLFSMILNGTFNEQMLDLGTNGQLTGTEEIMGEGSLSLSELGLSLEDLKQLLPPELLTQFVQSGGQDVLELQQFIQEQTGMEVDLAANLPANLSDAVVLLNQQGVDTKALADSVDTSSLPPAGQKVITALSTGQFQGQLGQQASQGQLSRDAMAEQLNLMQLNADDTLSDEMKAFFMKDEKNFSGSKAELFASQMNMKAAAQLSSESARSQSNDKVNPGQLVNPFAQQTPLTNDSPIIMRPVQVSAPVGQGQWGNEMNQQVMWLANQPIKSASIRLNPAELGPVEITIKMQNDVATVQFNSHSGQVRDLIEQALPRLREMMHDNGVQLDNVNVADNSAQQQSQRQASFEMGQSGSGGENFSGNSTGGEEQPSDEVLISEIKNKPQGLVDYFA